MLVSLFFLSYAFQQFVHRAAVNEIERVLTKTYLRAAKGPCHGPGVIPHLWIATSTSKYDRQRRIAK